MNYKRIALMILSLLTISFILHYIVYVRGYDQGYSYESVSNAMFIVGVVGFSPAFMAQMGSYKLFYGFQYAVRSFISTDFRRKYRKISDYLVDKKTDSSTSVYIELLLSSGALIISAIAFALLWGRQL